MKLTAIILLAFCLQLSAEGLTQTVTLSVKDAPLMTVLRAIEKQTGYGFFVDELLLQKASAVTLTVHNQPLEKVLDLCFKGQPLEYSISGKVIIVAPKDHKPLSNAVPTPPPVDVKGRVTNENGEPVFASVIVKGTKNGTTTSENGEFVLSNVDENATIVVSGVGLETREIKLLGQSVLNVMVKMDVSPLQETIIKGYYTTSKRLNTGNVSKVKSEQISMQLVSDPILALQGRVPGLFINQNAGVPGRNLGIRLRGQNSIDNGNEPLFIVDGVPFPSRSLSAQGGGGGFFSPFNDLNPNDVESIEVLKDADATAIYGSRGANGVILITTKKGIAGKTKFDINVSHGAGKVTRMVDMLDTDQYLRMRNEALRNDGEMPSSNPNAVLPEVYAPDLKVWDTSRYTDWQKIFIGGTAVLTDVQVGISGGNANTKFLISGNYRKETTVFPGDFFVGRLATHANINHQSNDQKFRLNFSTNYVVGNNKLPESDLTDYIKLAPNAPTLYDANRNLNWENNTWDNPFAILRRTNKSASNNLTSNAELAYNIIHGLEAKASFGYSNYRMEETNISPLSSYSPTLTNPALRTNTFANRIAKTWNIEPQISYQKTLGNSKIHLLTGATFLESVTSLLRQTASGFSSDDVIENIAAASQISGVLNSYGKYRYNAFFARIGYSWKERYLLNLTGRRDGSTRYGPKTRFGNFGAIGGAWVFSNESFIKEGMKVVSYGKIRGSYGVVGNDQFLDYLFIPTYNSYSAVYQGIAGITPTRLPNPYFEWETVRKLEVGLELGFIDNRILFNLSYFRNRTDNQLVQIPLPTLTGGASITGNLPAVIENKGIEIELNTTNLKGRKFAWTTSFNISIPRNRLVSFPGIEKTTYANLYTVGQSIFSRKTFRFTGVDPTTGEYSFEDINKDGSIDFPNDYASVKEVGQRFFGGLSNTISYKNITVDILLQFVNQTAENYVKSFSLPGATGGNNFNQPVNALNRWQKAGDISTLQKFTGNHGSRAASWFYYYLLSSDAIYSHASFVRLKNLQVSYVLPKTWQDKLQLQNARVYLRGQNLFTITNYEGLDPETRSLLPPIKMVSGGIQITF